MTTEPIDVAGPVGPVVRPVVPSGARSAEEIRADLAHCDRDGVPWPEAARRLLGDVPSLLAEVERLNLALNGWEDDVQDLRAEVERLDRANAKVALDFAAVSVERDSLQEQDERNHAEMMALAAEVRALRGVVHAVREWLAKAEPYPELNGNKFAEVRAALAAAADAPQPEPAAKRCAHFRTEAHPLTDRFGLYSGPDCPGPSPADAPEASS